MAGRILQLALVAAPGVLVVFASLDGEFKKQRKLRLEEEYKREVAATMNPQSAAPPTAPSVASPAIAERSPAKMGEPKAPTSSSFSWSSMLGLWAWRKDTEQTTASTADPPAQSKDGIKEMKGKS